jgi:hypothetical protein
MVAIEKYVHHNVEVSVLSDMKGKHQGNCLCWSGCKFFKPGTKENCNIAQTLFEVDKLYHITTPVFECPKYESEE